jgi:hypothetical protein
MKNALVLALALVGGLVLACDNKGDPGQSPIAMSAGAGKLESPAKALAAARAFQIEPIVGDHYYKERLKGLSKTQRRAQLTPLHFVLDLDSIKLYRKNASGGKDTATLWSLSKDPDGVIIPQHVNLAYADNFIRDAVVEGEVWDGLTMQFLPGVGESAGLPVHSLVGLEIPAEFAGIAFEGVTEYSSTDIPGLPAGLRYFSFADLQPFDTGDGFLSYLTIGSDLSATGIQNPSGQMPPEGGVWELPDGATNGNAVAIFAKAPAQIDFKGNDDPELVFVWDLAKLVEIYEKADGAYTISFRLDAPFPVTLAVQKNHRGKGAGNNAAAAPSEVLAAAAGTRKLDGFTEGWNVLEWINPPDPNFDRVVIVRKAEAPPAAMADGETVYEGYKPNFVDTTGTSGVHYYYRIFSKSFSGLFSAGVLVDHLQP